MNNTADENESDVDCGGSSKCEPCPLHARCAANSDCESNFCLGNRCTDPSCADHIKNQDETGVDCGGSCKPCDSAGPCVDNSDCESGYCLKGICSDHCISGVREADETDKDCGGATCAPCADRSRCQAASDCASLVCSNAMCRPASCTDQVKNQDESDIDCGVACSESMLCSVGAHCNTQVDCASFICSSAHKCSADIVVPPADVIDDFEDGDLSLPASPALGGRIGNWYAYDDGSASGSLEPFAIKRGASVGGLHVTGTGFKIWGSGVGVDLNDSSSNQSTKALYDAAVYTGITFWARAESTTPISVVLPDADTDMAGQTCTACAHHYSKTAQITPNWQRFTVAFSELELDPGGVPAPTAFKPSGLVSVQFRFAQGLSYDLYFDDLAFVKN